MLDKSYILERFLVVVVAIDIVIGCQMCWPRLWSFLSIVFFAWVQFCFLRRIFLFRLKFPVSCCVWECVCVCMCVIWY